MQLNALLDLASTPGSNVYSPRWQGPPIPNLNPTGQLTAIDVLNSAVGIVEDENTSSSSASSSRCGVCSIHRQLLLTYVILLRSFSVPSPSTSTAASNDTSTNSHRRISPGAIGGIVVGVIIFLFLVLAGIFFLWRRKRNHTDATTKETSADPYLHVKPLEDGSTPTLQVLPRLGGTRNEKRPIADRTTTTESIVTRPSAASPVPESSEPETSDVSSPVPDTESNGNASATGGQQVTVNLASFERLVQRLDTVIASGLPAQRVHQEQGEEEQPPRYEA